MRLLTILALVLVVIALIGQGSALAAAKRDANSGNEIKSHNHSDKSSSEEESSAEASDISKRAFNKRVYARDMFLRPPKAGREAI